MSRFNRYNNEFDPEDDGGDIQITAAEEAGSDDRGRQEAAVCISTAASIRGTKKPYEDHRRMWLRTAKKTLAEGRERRVKAASDEKAARLAAAKAAANKAENERRAKRSRESIGQFCVEFDERWARINEETRVANEAWEAGREEREAAKLAEKAEPGPTPMQAAASRPSEVRPQQRPASAATANPARQAAATALPTKIPEAAPPASRMTPESRPVRTMPPGQTTTRSQEPARALSQTRPATRTSAPPDLVRRPAPLATEPQRRVAPASTQPAWAPPSTGWPPRSASSTAVSSPARAATAASPLVVPESPRPAPPVQGRVLTGADLAAWRAARRLAQRPAADLLGVAPSTVAKAELLPGKVLGDQLQVALGAALGS